MSSLMATSVGTLIRQVTRNAAYSPFKEAIKTRSAFLQPTVVLWNPPDCSLFWQWRRRAAEEAARDKKRARRIGRLLTVGSVVLSVVGIIGSSIATAMMGGLEDEDEDEFSLDNIAVPSRAPRPLVPGPLAWPEEAATPCDRCKDEIADMLEESASHIAKGDGGSPPAEATPLVSSVPMPIPTLPGHIHHHHPPCEDHQPHFHLSDYTRHTPEVVNNPRSKTMDSELGKATITTVISTTVSTSQGSTAQYQTTLPPNNCPIRVTDAIWLDSRDFYLNFDLKDGKVPKSKHKSKDWSKNYSKL